MIKYLSLIFFVLFTINVLADVTLDTTKNINLSQLHNELISIEPLCDGLNTTRKNNEPELSIKFRCPSSFTSNQAITLIGNHVPIILPIPDIVGFINSLKNDFPRPRKGFIRIAIIQLRLGALADFEEFIIDSNTDETITPVQYAIIKNAVIVFDIPVTLP